MTETVNRLFNELKEAQDAEDESREEKKQLKRKLIECEANLKNFVNLKEYLESSLNEEKRRRNELGQRRKEILERVAEYQSDNPVSNRKESKDPIIKEEPMAPPSSRAIIGKEDNSGPKKIRLNNELSSSTLHEPKNFLVNKEEPKATLSLQNLMVEEKFTPKPSVARVVPTVSSNSNSTLISPDRRSNGTKSNFPAIPYSISWNKVTFPCYFGVSVNGKMLTSTEFEKFHVELLNANKRFDKTMESSRKKPSDGKKQAPFICTCILCLNSDNPFEGESRQIQQHQTEVYKLVYYCLECDFTISTFGKTSIRSHLKSHLIEKLSK